MGPESLTFARTTEIDSFQPPGPSRPASAEPAGRDQGAPGQDAETPNSKQSATFGGSLPGYERDREERIRRDHLRRRDQCPRVPKEAPSHRQPHSGDANQAAMPTIPRKASPFWNSMQPRPPVATTRPCKSSSSTPQWQTTLSSRTQRSTRHLGLSSTRSIVRSTAAKRATFCWFLCAITFRSMETRRGLLRHTGAWAPTCCGW